VTTVAQDIRETARELKKVLEESRAASVIGPAVNNAIDHITAIAGYQEQLIKAAEAVRVNTEEIVAIARQHMSKDEYEKFEARVRGIM
jgi:hypothetical protein